jgi:hypothetical protein
VSDEQNEKTSSSIRRSFDPDSKLTAEIDLHRAKQDLQRISTEEGIQIDFSDEQTDNALSSIR